MTSLLSAVVQLVSRWPVQSVTEPTISLGIMQTNECLTCWIAFRHFAAKNRKLSEKNVLLLDGAPQFKGYNQDGYSNRVFAINHNTVKLMEEINAWATIAQIRCRPVNRMQVWESYSDALIAFEHDHPASSVAYIVENDVMLHAILKELESATNVTIKNAAKIDRVLLERDGAPHGTVQLQSGETFTADLLVNNNNRQ